MAIRKLQNGIEAQDVLSEMETFRSHDVRWRDGRCFTLAYSAGPEALAIAEEAYRRFSGENALNTAAFPSLKHMAQEVVDTVAGWCNGDDDVAGFMTSGGTESLVLVVRSAVMRAKREGRLTATPNMVLPTSAHAALEKGADYFSVEARRVDVGPDWRANVSAMRAAVDENTILIVGSAPQYPQGVVDPIVHLAAIALEHDINCHVDACMGGVTLPYLEDLGEEIAPWDFRVDGVTSISVDLHKYGYTSKGAGVLLHKSKKLRSDQTFMTDNWLGGMYGSSGILGTKSGGPIASAWAVMRFLGHNGYQNVTRSARASALRIAAHIDAHPLLVLRAQPDTTLLCFGTADPKRHDVFALAELLIERGWFMDRQTPPASIHLTVHAGHEARIDEFLKDLDECILEIEGRTGSVGSYATTD
jgi:glutamate/tyrosine decarboxylase-like PLP-dependent enzyme